MRKLQRANQAIMYMGGYFPYKQWKDRVVDCASCGFTNGTTAIEPLEVALTYFHYGDQLVIMNFEKTENQLESGVFSAYANMKKGCFDVSHVFIVDVYDMSEKATIDFIMETVNDDYWKDYASKTAIGHLINAELQ